MKPISKIPSILLARSRARRFPRLLIASSVIFLNSTQLWAQGIKITRFEATPIDKQATKMVISATGKGVKVGSYLVTLLEGPGKEAPKGFIQTSEKTSWFYNGGSVQEPSPYLTDNGSMDEDPKKGVLTLTFHTAEWSEGRYIFKVAACNRPGDGNYFQDYVTMKIDVGDIPPQPVSNIPSAVHQVIYSKPGVYACFPSLSVLPDGRLFTRFFTRTARSHVDDTGGTMSLVSSDNGKTWSQTADSCYDRMQTTKDGRLVTAGAVGWIETDASREEALKKAHIKTMVVRPGIIAYRGGARASTSNDGGATWTSSKIECPPDCLGLMNYQKAASEIVTSKNIRLTAVYGTRLRATPPQGGGPLEVYFLRSEDDGKTWKCAPMYPEGLPDPKIGFDETAIAETLDGTILAMMRSSEENYLWQARSSDGGLSWSKPVKTSIWGYPANLMRLKDGRLLCLYGYRKSPMGIRGVLSHDNGVTWDIGNELIIRADGLGTVSDLGYPLGYQLPDGSIFVIYYLTTDGVTTFIGSTHFELKSR